MSSRIPSTQMSFPVRAPHRPRVCPSTAHQLQLTNPHCLSRSQDGGRGRRDVLAHVQPSGRRRLHDLRRHRVHPHGRKGTPRVGTACQGDYRAGAVSRGARVDTLARQFADILQDRARLRACCVRQGRSVFQDQDPPYPCRSRDS